MPRVLIVHDDIAEISAVKRVVVRAGHQPALATTFAEAAAALARDPPAVLVVGSTCEAGAALKGLAGAVEAAHLPMVVLGVTAAAPEAAAQVPRPLDPSQLAERLAAALAAGAAPNAPDDIPVAPPPPSRREAAAALRARAEELRRAGAGPAASARSGAAGGPARRDAAPAGGAGRQEALELELERLGQQLDEERRAARARIRSEADRASAANAAEARRRQEQDARRRSDDGAAGTDEDEEQLRSAIASARAELEAQRRRSEDEARRRAAAEAEIARLGREAGSPRAATAEPPAPAAEPEPDPAEQSARRRVAPLLGRPAAAPPARAEAEAPPTETGSSPPPRMPPPELRAGTLADLPAPRLLAMAARARVSGRLDFEGEASRSLYLEEGAVVGATSSDPGERVEEIALRLGLVTREQHRHASAAAAPLGARRAALALLERGFLKPTELTGLARRRTEEVVFGVFGDAAARFRWAAADVPPDERVALERTTLALALEGVRRRWLGPAVDAVLGGAGTLLAPVEGGPAPAELALRPDERRAVALADGLRTLDEIVASSPLDPLSTRQALAALVLVGALAVRTFQGGRPAAVASAAIDLERVREKLEQVRRADYFTVLGVGRLCTPHEVRDAFERLRAEFDPRLFHGVREEGLERHLDEILAVVADARDVLADDRLREEYLRGLGLR